MHLQIITERLKSRFQVEVELVQPKIPYRETIRKKGNRNTVTKNKPEEQDSLPKSGCVWIPAHATAASISRIPVGQNVDWLRALRGQRSPGRFTGRVLASPGGDVKIDFYDGKQHPVDSKDVAFQIAGKQAFKQGILECDPCLLEPIHDLEIKVPEDHMGDVMGDISGRRGKSRNGRQWAYQIIRPRFTTGTLQLRHSPPFDHRGTRMASGKFRSL